MEADKILRFLKTPPTAGFERASLWMKGDSALRSKAVDVFADIGDEASLQKLAIMTKDSNVAVAESAQIALSNLKQKR
jgi:HEAT repeat protein